VFRAKQPASRADLELEVVMTGWGDNHYPPIPHLKEREGDRRQYKTILDDQEGNRMSAANFLKLVDSLLANETVLILLLAFLLSVIPFMLL
jgi:hypothetical protein